MVSACGPGIEIDVQCSTSFNGAAPNVSPAPNVDALVEKMRQEFRETGGKYVNDDGRSYASRELTPGAMEYIEQRLDDIKNAKTPEEQAAILKEIVIIADGTSMDPDNVIRNLESYKEIHEAIGIDPPQIPDEAAFSRLLGWDP